MLPFLSAFAGALQEAASPPATVISFNGTFTTGSFGSPVTSALLTIDVPGGSSGTILFQGFESSGGVSLQISDNGAAFATISDGHSLTQADGETLQIRMIGYVAGSYITFTLVDSDTNEVIETVRLSDFSGFAF